MNNLFPDPENEKIRKVESLRVRTMIEERLGSQKDSYLIKIMQLDHCPDPECESIETVIILLKENMPPLQFRFACSLSEITEATLTPLFNAV